MRRFAYLTGLLVIALSLATGGLAFAKPAATPITYFVDADAAGLNTGASWENAFTDLQGALAVAVAGDSIWVATGTYRPSVSFDSTTETRTASFSLKSGVALFGGFTGDEKKLEERSSDPALTVLSGDIGEVGNAADNSYHVLYAVGVTGAVLDGFTVTGGLGNRSSGTQILRDTRGAGMYNVNSSLAVTNCVFSGNRVAGAPYSIVAGPGMYNYMSAPVVTNCVFTGNYAGENYTSCRGQGGGMYNFGYYDNSASPVIIGCTFVENRADGTAAGSTTDGGGGGMYNDRAEPTVQGCTFSRNLGGNGGGVLNFRGGARLTNCVFDTNSNHYYEGRGGGILNVGKAIITNCTFYQNGWQQMSSGPEPRFRPYTQSGGAICDFYMTGSEITNCIFIGNAAKYRGGAIYTQVPVMRATKLTNCLFYENISWFPGHTQPEASDTYGNCEQTSALTSADPLLMAPASGDYRLRWDSPCIDAGFSGKQGNLLWPDLPSVDLYGSKRIADGDADGEIAIDVGADEYVPELYGLRGSLMALSASGQLESTVADRGIAYVDSADVALAAGDEATAIASLNELIADVKATLGESETALLIERKTRAVIEEI